MVSTIFVLAFSFTASLGFAVVFNIHSREKLLYAGLGGFITRLVYIILSSFIQQRFIYILIASMVASIYGETLACKQHIPASYFIYPSIIPLIPGDLFHYMIASILTGNIALAKTQGIDCLLSLIAMSLGTIISTTTFQSIRRSTQNQDD